jgi:hypothetical protein
LTGLKINLGSQEREIDLGNFDPCNVVPGPNRALSIRIGQRMAEPVSRRIGVALDYRDVSGHDL